METDSILADMPTVLTVAVLRLFVVCLSVSYVFRLNTKQCILSRAKVTIDCLKELHTRNRLCQNQ